MVRNFTYEDLFMFLRYEGNLNPQNVDSRRFLLQIFKQKYDGQHWDTDYEMAINDKIRNFCTVLSKLWIKSSRVCKRFTENNIQWLKTEFVLPKITPMPSSLDNKVVGRPSKPFSECSDRSKRRKIMPLTKSYYYYY